MEKSTRASTCRKGRPPGPPAMPRSSAPTRPMAQNAPVGRDAYIPPSPFRPFGIKTVAHFQDSRYNLFEAQKSANRQREGPTPRRPVGSLILPTTAKKLRMQSYYTLFPPCKQGGMGLILHPAALCWDLFRHSAFLLPHTGPVRAVCPRRAPLWGSRGPARGRR